MRTTLRNWFCCSVAVGALALGLNTQAALAADTADQQTASPDDRRFVQLFIQDAALVENGWIEGQVRLQTLSNDDDVFRIGPLVAFSPIDKLEFGARLDFIDRDVTEGNGDPGRSESGIGDTTAWAKWQFFHNPVQFTVGVEVFLPTGNEDDYLGSGEFDFGFFGAVRKNLEDAYLTGHFGFRVNGDSTVDGNDLEGDTSIFLGGGVMFPIHERFSLSGELRVETERYDNDLGAVPHSDSAIDLTVGGYWYATKRSTVRGGVALGLEDGAPDWQFIAGYAWHY